MRQFPVRHLTRTALLLAVAIAVQSLRLQPPLGQLVTGGGVNAVLFLAVVMVNVWAGVAIGLITPGMALLMGINKLPFMVPFIMVANVTLVLVFAVLMRFSRFFAAVVAAIAKYGFFLLTVNVLVGLIGKSLPPAAAVSFGVTQLVTAIIGGLLAMIVAESLKPFRERE